MIKKKIRVVIHLSKKHNVFLKEDKVYYIPQLEKDLTKYQMLPEIGEILDIAHYDKYIDYFTGEKVGPFPVGATAIVTNRSYFPSNGSVDLTIVPRYEYESNFVSSEMEGFS